MNVHRTYSIACAITILVVSSMQPVARAGVGPLSRMTGFRSTYQVVGAGRELVDWAAGRFDAAGLGLPTDLVIDF